MPVREYFGVNSILPPQRMTKFEIVSASNNIPSRPCWGPAKHYATPRGMERTAN